MILFLKVLVNNVLYQQSPQSLKFIFLPTHKHINYFTKPSAYKYQVLNKCLFNLTLKGNYPQKTRQWRRIKAYLIFTFKRSLRTNFHLFRGHITKYFLVKQKYRPNSFPKFILRVFKRTSSQKSYVTPTELISLCPKY